MKVLVTGRGGQLASSLKDLAPEDAEIHSFSVDELDITDRDHVMQRITTLRPDVIINGAAFTAVDKAEEQSDLAHRVNALGPMHLSMAASEIGSRLVQPSTDFVFDGEGETPWKPDSTPSPVSVYGRTKLEGEESVIHNCRAPWTIVRTAWVYSDIGSNFLLSMLRFMKEGKSLRIIDDQHGTPTWSGSLARAIWCLIDRKIDGIQHWTDDGSTTWFGFASAIGELGVETGMLQTMPEISPIPTSEYPTPATRPAFSVLDKSGTWSLLDGAHCMPPVHWRENLRNVMMELKHG